MLKTFVAFMLGPGGLKILYFYLEHDVLINSIVFVYGVFLVLAHYNYRKISEEIIAKIPNPAKKKNSKAAVEVDINKAIAEQKTFPFVAGNISIVPRKLTAEAVKGYLLKDKKWITAVKDREVHFMD